MLFKNIISGFTCMFVILIFFEHNSLLVHALLRVIVQQSWNWKKKLILQNMWPTLPKGELSRWEDQETAGENITQGPFLPNYCFWCFHIVGRLFDRILTADGPFRPYMTWPLAFWLLTAHLDYTWLDLFDRILTADTHGPFRLYMTLSLWPHSDCWRPI